MKKVFTLLCLSAICIAASSQNEIDVKPRYPKAIEDNSYFIEEAYNQEDRVVQHINNGKYTHGSSKDFEYSFTQEWPVFSQKHQFSYTIGYSSLNSGQMTGFTDVMLNYRYQLTGHDDFITLSPRVSLILPTGNEDKGLGNGVLGYQFNLPASKRISNSFVLHANVGYTHLPYVKTIDLNNVTYKNTHWIINAGGSAIWLATDKLNIMFEALHIVYSEADISGKTATHGQTIISPGFRYAIDIKNLQIVPGLAIPVVFEGSEQLFGAFFYVSFEHPF
ncbi:MAG: hypothetical protein M0P66_12260 [Salinivirgaceae bacterium]|nr:hypothetical protein [Salinivirgaceae bacterium]